MSPLTACGTKSGNCVKIIAWILIGVLGSTLSLSAREPSYGGKNLSAWLEDLYEATGGGPLWEGPGVGADGAAAPGSAAPNPALRARQDQAVEAIRKMGTEAIPHLMKIFYNRKTGLMKRIVTFSFRPTRPASERYLKAVGGFRALGSMAEMAVPELTEFLEQGETAYEASLALAAIGPAAVPALIQALGQHDERVWLAAAEALGQVLTTDEGAVPMLLKCVKHRDPLVRSYAVGALGEVGRGSHLVVPALIQCLEDPLVLVRVRAAEALGQFGAEAAGARAALSKALQDLDTGVREAAGRALREMEAGIGRAAGRN